MEPICAPKYGSVLNTTAVGPTNKERSTRPEKLSRNDETTQFIETAASVSRCCEDRAEAPVPLRAKSTCPSPNEIVLNRKRNRRSKNSSLGTASAIVLMAETTTKLWFELRSGWC